MSGSFPHQFEATDLTVGALHIIDQDRIWHSNPVDSTPVDPNGIPDDRHYGATRKLRPYESPELAGLVVANDRQLSVVEAEDMLVIADGLGLPIDRLAAALDISVEQFMAGQLAANVLLSSGSGQKLGSKAQIGSVLVFGDRSSGEPAAVKLTGYNPPCNKPMKKLATSLDKLGILHSFPELSARFKTLAEARRGWVASVYAPGTLATGQTVSILAPITLR